MSVIEPSNQIKEFIQGIDGVVEATTDEQMYIWQRYHKEYGKTWEGGRSGYGVCVAILYQRPICISILTTTVDGTKVLFWHATSELVDYKLIGEWMEKYVLPICNGNKTDATNFGNILKRNPSG